MSTALSASEAGTKRKAMEVKLPEPASKKTTMSVGHHFSELKSGDEDTFFQVASRVFGAVFDALAQQSIVRLLSIASEHDLSIDKVANVWSQWKQATDGDRPHDRSMPSAWNPLNAPKRTMEQKWEGLKGTEHSDARKAFMTEVHYFAEHKESLLTSMCKEGDVDIHKVRLEIESIKKPAPKNSEETKTDKTIDASEKQPGVKDKSKPKKSSTKAA